MSRPRRVSDEEILLGVRRAVLDKGPHVSMDVVAEDLGVTAPALYRRFGSRTELLTAALRPADRPPFLDALDQGPDGRPVAEQLVDLLTQIGTYLSGVLPCLIALGESGLSMEEIHQGRSAEPPPLQSMRAISAWLVRARERGLVHFTHPECLATAMLGAVQAPIFFRHLAKQADLWDPAHHARELVELFLQGIAPPG